MLTVGYGCSPTGRTATEAARQVGKKRELGLAYGMGRRRMFGGVLTDHISQLNYAELEMRALLSAPCLLVERPEWETCLDE